MKLPVVFALQCSQVYAYALLTPFVFAWQIAIRTTNSVGSGVCYCCWRRDWCLLWRTWRQGLDSLCSVGSSSQTLGFGGLGLSSSPVPDPVAHV